MPWVHVCFSLSLSLSASLSLRRSSPSLASLRSRCSRFQKWRDLFKEPQKDIFFHHSALVRNYVAYTKIHLSYCMKYKPIITCFSIVYYTYYSYHSFWIGFQKVPYQSSTAKIMTIPLHPVRQWTLKKKHRKTNNYFQNGFGQNNHRCNRHKAKKHKKENERDRQRDRARERERQYA